MVVDFYHQHPQIHTKNNLVGKLMKNLAAMYTHTHDVMVKVDHVHRKEDIIFPLLFPKSMQYVRMYRKKVPKNAYLKVFKCLFCDFKRRVLQTCL